MELKSVLDIIGYGAWNDGALVDNAIFEKKGLFFKGGIPVTDQSIRDRIGVRTRMAAPSHLRIGRIALQNLLENCEMDLSRIKLVIGAENIHRANAFKPDDTANIIFGDDALATALQTQAALIPSGSYSCSEAATLPWSDDFVERIADTLLGLNGRNRLDGIRVDNQLGNLLLRVPAIAVRIQNAWVEKMYPEKTGAGMTRSSFIQRVGAGG